MTCRLICFALLFGPTVFGSSLTGVNAPVKKFRLPGFNDQGFRTSLLQGDEARMISATQIDLKEMHFTLFQGDEKNSVDSTLLAPVATVLIQDQNKIVVQGEGSVRFIRPDIDASGQQWKYEHAEKHLTMHKDVRLVIRAELKDILK